MKKLILAITLLFTMSITIAGCSKDNKDKTVKQIEDTLNTIVMNTENDSLNEEIDR